MLQVILCLGIVLTGRQEMHIVLDPSFHQNCPTRWPLHWALHLHSKIGPAKTNHVSTWSGRQQMVREHLLIRHCTISIQQKHTLGLYNHFRSEFIFIHNHYPVRTLTNFLPYWWVSLGLGTIQHFTELQLSFSRPQTERKKKKRTDATNHDGRFAFSCAENVNLSESSSPHKNTHWSYLGCTLFCRRQFDTKKEYFYSIT